MVYVIIVSVIIVSIVVIGCIIILRLHCMVCILQWNLRIMIQPITTIDTIITDTIITYRIYYISSPFNKGYDKFKGVLWSHGWVDHFRLITKTINSLTTKGCGENYPRPLLKLWDICN